MNYEDTTYTTSGPGRLAGPSAVLAAMESYVAELRRQSIQALLAFKSPLFAEPLRGEVRVEHLGPEGREFKIVRLLGGKRVLVDQDVKVEDPFLVRFSWEQAWVQTPDPRRLLRVVCS